MPAAIPPLLEIFAVLTSGSSYNPGDQISISWSMTDNGSPYWDTNKSLRFDLVDSDDVFVTEIYSTSNKGVIDYSILSGTYKNPSSAQRFTWTFPMNLTSQDYKVRARVAKTYYWYSAAFTFDATVLVVITAPATSAEWTQGTTQTIEWASSGFDAGDLGDFYYRPLGGANWFLIEAGIGLKADTSYAWKVSPTIAPGYYQIGIKSDRLDIYSISDVFSVVARSITITAPTGSIVEGEETTITWTQIGYDTVDINNDISIYYRLKSTQEKTLIANTTGDLETQTWTTPEVPGRYEIVIHDSYYDIGSEDYKSSEFVSATITLVNKEITIITPAWGTQWHRGVAASTIVTSTAANTIYTSTTAVDSTPWILAGVLVGDLITADGKTGTVTIVNGTTHTLTVASWTGGTPTNATAAVVTRPATSETATVTWSYVGYESTDSISIYAKKTTDTWNATPGSGTDITIASDIEIGLGLKTWAISATQTMAAYNLKIIQNATLPEDSDTYPTEDFVFSISDGKLDFNSLQRATYLVAVTDNKVFYEDSNHVMTNVAGATVSPASYVVCVPAYQKVFIADGNYQSFKYLDLVNVKITGSVTGTLVSGDLLIGETSGASLIYGRVEGASLYAYRINSTPIVSSEKLKLDGSNYWTAGDTGTSPPHWLTWVADAGKGSLPNTATIGCLFLGRIVLAGDKMKPHMWYMCRQSDPWDWLYAAGDAQSAISGADGDIGRIGDIITALIPFQDDSLIIGCSKEIWLVRGDPAAGGTLNKLADGDGIFGPKSWCKDANNNLYFVGMGGLYRLAVGSSSPQPLTQSIIPGFMDGISRNTHWITMVHDVRRHGILIFITNVDKTANNDEYGQCDAWWYDLATKGLFPEAYPQNSGVFSSLYYGAESGEYEMLVLGCHDGFLRSFDDTQLSDEDGTGNDVSIGSYVMLPPQEMSYETEYGRLTRTVIVTGGGTTDTDSVYYEIITGETAEDVLNYTTANITGTVTGVSRLVSRERARGRYMGIRFSNSNVGESFSIEKVAGDIVPAGR